MNCKYYKVCEITLERKDEVADGSLGEVMEQAGFTEEDMKEVLELAGTIEEDY